MPCWRGLARRSSDPGQRPSGNYGPGPGRASVGHSDTVARRCRHGRENGGSAGTDEDLAESAGSPKAPLIWAERSKRVFRIEITMCPHCGGRLRVIAYVTDPDVIDQVLEFVRRAVPRAPPGALRFRLKHQNLSQYPSPSGRVGPARRRALLASAAGRSVRAFRSEDRKDDGAVHSNRRPPPSPCGAPHGDRPLHEPESTTAGSRCGYRHGRRARG